VQINIEGFHALGANDIPGYFHEHLHHRQGPQIDAGRRNSLVKAAAEKPAAELPDDVKKKIPRKGLVVEIRGYTYHKDGESFVINR